MKYKERANLLNRSKNRAQFRLEKREEIWKIILRAVHTFDEKSEFRNFSIVTDETAPSESAAQNEVKLTHFQSKKINITIEGQP